HRARQAYWSGAAQDGPAGLGGYKARNRRPGLPGSTAGNRGVVQGRRNAGLYLVQLSPLNDQSPLIAAFSGPNWSSTVPGVLLTSAGGTRAWGPTGPKTAFCRKPDMPILWPYLDFWRLRGLGTDRATRGVRMERHGAWQAR